MVSMGILNKSLFIPTYWFIPIIILGYVLIYLDWKNKKIVRPRPGKITPPPEGYIPKIRRTILIMGILLLHMFLFLGNYSPVNTINSEVFSEVVFWNSFVVLRRDLVFMGWLSFLGIFGLAIFILQKYFSLKI